MLVFIRKTCVAGSIAPMRAGRFFNISGAKINFFQCTIKKKKKNDNTKMKNSIEIRINQIILFLSCWYSLERPVFLDPIPQCEVGGFINFVILRPLSSKAQLYCMFIEQVITLENTLTMYHITMSEHNSK